MKRSASKEVIGKGKRVSKSAQNHAESWQTLNSHKLKLNVERRNSQKNVSVIGQQTKPIRMPRKDALKSFERIEILN